jgi:hypothetical protein
MRSPFKPRRCDEVAPTSEGVGCQAVLEFEERSDETVTPPGRGS